jgi:hypothetical protein
MGGGPLSAKELRTNREESSQGPAIVRLLGA